jgi:tripartite-type tricarboxylate transporter receptor subunit TctC
MTAPAAGRHGLRALLAAPAIAAAGALPGAASAQDYPSRPVTLVVPYGPGSSTDNIARPVALALQEALGQPVVVDNRSGANGVVGTQFAARARPDGYTILVGSSTTLAANAGLFKTLPYDPQKDFTPIAGVASTSMMFAVRADSAAKDMRGFLDQAARQGDPPPAVAYGSSSAQVALALLMKASGTRALTAVPYRDTPQTIADLMGGRIAMGIIDVGNGVPHIAAGRLHALAISAATRSDYAPDVPTLDELWPGTRLVTWIGLVAPAGTPAPIVDRIERTVAAAMAGPEIRQRFAAIGTEIDHVGQGELARRMRDDRSQWLELIRMGGIEPQ